MNVIARASLLPWLLTVAVAQQPDEPEPPQYRGKPFEHIERENKLLDLQWRRDANGDLEWSIPGDKAAKWKPMFGVTLSGVLGPGGMGSYVVPLLHHGDLLSLTDGEEHFRRLGIATGTQALLAFARAPLEKPPSRVDELDRLVAVDVLRSRTDDAAKRAVAQLAADAGAPAAVRARAATATIARERLGADELPLPERPDLVVMVDHARLVDARPLLGLARLSGLVSSGMVMSMLKMPLVDDAATGQAESDSCLELPFELVRRLGAVRFDQTCVSVTWPREIGGDFAWTAALAGAFEPARVADALNGAALEGSKVAATAEGASIAWAGGGGTVTTRRAFAQAKGLDAKPRPEIASHVLGGGDCSLRVHVPPRSKALAVLATTGLGEVAAYDLTLAIGDTIVVREQLTAKSEEAAAKLADAIPRVMERLVEQNEVAAGFFEKLGPLKPTVAGDVVTTVREIQFAQLPLPTIEAARQWLLDRGRKRVPR